MLSSRCLLIAASLCLKAIVAIKPQSQAVLAGEHSDSTFDSLLLTEDTTDDGSHISDDNDSVRDEDLLIIDGHNDFPIWTRAFYHNRIYEDNFTETSTLVGQVDFPRLSAGNAGAQFWSVYVECPRGWEGRGYDDDSLYYENVHDTLQQIDLVERMVARFPRHMQPARTAADVLRQHREYLDEKAAWEEEEQQQQKRQSRSSPTQAKPAPTRRVSSLLGIEGLHQIGNSASILRQYFALGVRYATLTHTCHNAYADSEEPARPAHGGLSERGVAIVREMNRLGMMVDLSHTSAETQRAALKATRAPVIFSHSNAYTLYNHTRNIPDDVLLALKRNGGVAMVTFYPAFLRASSSGSVRFGGDGVLHPAMAEMDDGQVEASMQDVVNHIVYIGELIGYEHVGIGSDFDGMAQGPRGLEHVGKYPALVTELKRRGVRGKLLAGVMGLNVVRVLGEVEKIAASLSRRELPLEDRVKPFFDD